MNTLVIYDNSGNVYSQITGSYVVPSGGVQFIEVVIPDGKRIAKIDTSVIPNVPEFEAIPPTEADRISSLEDVVNTLMGV